MEWDIALSRQVQKFLSQHHLADDAVTELLARAVKKFNGETVALDLKRLTGKWEGCFRIRTSKYRIIFSINFEAHSVFVEIFDNRDSSYKRHA